MKIVVIGASAAGLSASLLLARAGHEILVFDKDPVEPAPDVDTAASRAYRRSAPQIVQPHMVMSMCRELVREHLPDVYGALLAAGAVEGPLWTRMPEALADREARPDDERLTLLAVRRSTFDWVLLRTALAESSVSVQGGTRVTGLRATAGDPPRVMGVQTDGCAVDADLVIDASGYRSPIDRWLTEIGAASPAHWRAESGVAYFSRHYRIRPGALLPSFPTTRLLVGLDELTLGIWGADNAVMQLAVVPLASDHRFRTLQQADVFDAVLRTVPAFAAWLDALDPIGGVYPMGGPYNTLRRLVVDGRPVVAGLHALGDSVCTTNPTLGRGLSLALWQAVDLAATIGRYGDNWTGQSLAFDALVGEHVAPYYVDQAAIDSERLAALRHAIYGAPLPLPSPPAGRVTYAQVRAAANYNPIALRAFWRIMGMLERPDDVYGDPLVVEATRSALHRHGGEPLLAQPSRTELLAALTPQLPAA
jgi:flavin-dependent dehydrogenase